MPVYVDNATHPLGRMKTHALARSASVCHMIADTLDELHVMAERVGMKREWFQNHDTPHYDLSLSKRALAVQYGAIEISSRQLVQLIREWRASKMAEKLDVIKVTSGYGGNTRLPFVEIKTDKLKEPLQLDPAAARDLAVNLLQAAEASEQDAFMFEFVSKDLKAGDQSAAGIIHEFRKWRDGHGQNK